MGVVEVPVTIMRGLEVDRTAYTGLEAELACTTDEKKLYLHDGSTPGGVLINPPNNKYITADYAAKDGDRVIVGASGLTVDMPLTTGVLHPMQVEIVDAERQVGPYDPLILDANGSLEHINPPLLIDRSDIRTHPFANTGGHVVLVWRPGTNAWYIAAGDLFYSFPPDRLLETPLPGALARNGDHVLIDGVSLRNLVLPAVTGLQHPVRCTFSYLIPNYSLSRLSTVKANTADTGITIEGVTTPVTLDERIPVTFIFDERINATAWQLQKHTLLYEYRKEILNGATPDVPLDRTLGFMRAEFGGDIAPTFSGSVPGREYHLFCYNYSYSLKNLTLPSSVVLDPAGAGSVIAVPGRRYLTLQLRTVGVDQFSLESFHIGNPSTAIVQP